MAPPTPATAYMMVSPMPEYMMVVAYRAPPHRAPPNTIMQASKKVRHLRARPGEGGRVGDGGHEGPEAHAPSLAGQALLLRLDGLQVRVVHLLLPRRALAGGLIVVVLPCKPAGADRPAMGGQLTPLHARGTHPRPWRTATTWEKGARGR
jgi:hypothetical protein